MKPRFSSMDIDKVFLERDDKFPTGYGVDAKWVGNILDDIFEYMEHHKIKIIPELMELKQFLRFKGNSLREQGNFKYWNKSGEKIK